MIAVGYEEILRVIVFCWRTMINHGCCWWHITTRWLRMSIGGHMLFSAVVRLLVQGAGVCERTSHRTKLRAVALYGQLFGVLPPFLPRGCVSEVALHGRGHKDVPALTFSSFFDESGSLLMSMSSCRLSPCCWATFVKHYEPFSCLLWLSTIIPNYIPSVVGYTVYPHPIVDGLLYAIISHF